MILISSYNIKYVSIKKTNFVEVLILKSRCACVDMAVVCVIGFLH